MKITLGTQFADDLPEMADPAVAAPTPDSQTHLVNAALATELGLDPEWLRSAEGAIFLTGHGGESVTQRPVAQRYSGHQFGGFSPLLGDGRAMLLGEIRTASGEFRDLHLKGSGPTPFSRGDGMATLDATLREFLMSEAMHALGIPTTRALAVATTGRRLMRDNVTHDNVLPGSVLTRVASSHVRVGSFQYARITGDTGLLTRLLEHTITRTDPDLSDILVSDRGHADAATELLRRVVHRQGALVADWMLVGFVHGVMNTDNVLISGETIDYGPCAFLDEYASDAVFSSIDHAGRYAYGAQRAIIAWNLGRLADALLPLIDTDQSRAITVAEGVLAELADAFSTRWEPGMRAKLGLAVESQGGPSQATVSDLTRTLFEIMERERLDFTTTFRALTGAASELSLGETARSAPAALTDWVSDWSVLHPDFFTMVATNPVTIPRNRHLQSALDEAVQGDLTPFTELLDAVTDPYTERAAWAKYATAGDGRSAPFITYCGT